MKGLVIAFFAWSFVGVFSYAAWPELLGLNLSVFMLLSSLMATAYFKSIWWGATLLISFPTFYTRLTLLLHTYYELPIDLVDITWSSIGLTLMSVTLILTYLYLPRWN